MYTFTYLYTDFAAAVITFGVITMCRYDGSDEEKPLLLAVGGKVRCGTEMGHKAVI